MIKTLFGFLLLISPAAFLIFFKDRKQAWLKIFSFSLLGHLVVSIVTQSFGIFNYAVVATIIFLIMAVIIYSLTKNFEVCSFDVDWYLVAFFCLAFFQLYSVHFNYTGSYSTVLPPSYKEVKHAQFAFPYYADEWSAVAYVKQTIKTQHLPIENPFLSFKHPIINFEFVFHAVLSEIFLLLNIDPLYGYVYLVLLSGLVLFLNIYIFLRTFRVSHFVSGLGSVAFLYITQGANLPGIWSLIPFSVGLNLFWVLLSFALRNDIFMMRLTAVLLVLFYPPLYPFVFLSLLTYEITSNSIKKFSKRELWFFIAILILTISLIALATLNSLKASTVSVTKVILDKFFYDNFTPNSIPDLAVWHVLPLVVLIIALVGFIIYPIRKAWFLAPFAWGILYWGICSFTTKRFLIEHQRVVVLTSTMICVYFAFGFEYVFEYLKKKRQEGFNYLLGFLKLLIVVVLILSAFKYTQLNRWNKLPLHELGTKNYLMPSAPANAYLTLEDLKIFQHIQGKTFLSLPWKGLVIAAATGNFPLHIKSGAIGLSAIDYSLFMKADCDQKTKLAQQYGMDYVYSAPFVCPDFILVDQSQEGLGLYRSSIAKGLLN